MDLRFDYTSKLVSSVTNKTICKGCFIVDDFLRHEAGKTFDTIVVFTNGKTYC